MIKIDGIPLLEHQIRGYNHAGVEAASISVVSGYQHGHVKRYVMREHPDTRLVRSSKSFRERLRKTDLIVLDVNLVID